MPCVHERTAQLGTEPEQTHDDCQWLDEEDGKEKVPGNWRRWYGNDRSPIVAENEGRDADRKHHAVTENGMRDRHHIGEIRLGGIFALRGGTATISLCLGERFSGCRLVRVPAPHWTGPVLGAARHARFRCGRPARADPDIPDNQGNREDERG
jgi:hypothetical protein